VADVRITEFTDPGCPWAYSAEPFRRRLDWLYGDWLEWDVRLVGLSSSPDDYAERGLTPEKQAKSLRSIAHEHGMPIDTRERAAPWWPLAGTPRSWPGSCCAACGCATSPASCSTTPRR